MRISTTVTFEKRLGKLPVRLQVKFRQRMLLFVQDPQNPLLKVHALRGGLLGYSAFSVTGDYRVVYRVIAVDRIELTNIGTHSQIYK